MIKPAVNGNTVVSTLDVNVQNAVEKRIQEWMTETGSDHVGVVVMNPNNGEILAMAGESPFDLNNPREVSSRYTDAEIRQLGVKEAVGDYKRKHRNTRSGNDYRGSGSSSLYGGGNPLPGSSGGLESGVEKFLRQRYL